MKRERIFELTLPAVVKGLDASGKRFEEQTSTCSLSAQEASFHLDTPLLIGTKLNLSLEVPRTLILEKPLRLQVSGMVVYVRSELANGKSQLAIVRLERSFRLLPSFVSHS
jgi:hypothetical protein